MTNPRDTLGAKLLAHARSTIGARLGLPTPTADADDPAFSAPGATFVTLTRGGQLRGCIGSLSPTAPLLEDLRSNALAAAFRDPRFPPLSAEEWPQIAVEVSLLGPVTWDPCPSRRECLALIGPGYGVILASGVHRATFLPQVWEQLRDADEFVDHLLRKAGLPADRWPANMQLGRYRVEKFREHP